MAAPRGRAGAARAPRVGSEILLAALAVAGHGLAALVYALRRAELDLPSAWDAQFYVLVAVSLLLSCAAVAWRGAARARAAVAASFGCYLLACFPLPASSGVQATLGMPLMMAVVTAFPRPDCYFLGSVSIALALLIQRPGILWGRPASGADPASLLALGAELAFVLAIGAAVKELAEARRKSLREAERLDSAIDRIADVNASFQSALAAAEESSIRMERNRITREIHDIVGYALTNQQMMLEASLMLVEPGGSRLRELLSMAREGVAEGLRETRKTLYELRRIGEPVELGFPALLKAARNFEAVTGIRVALDFTNASGDVGHQGWLSIYRLVQESMINSFRHGHAANIAITFREDTERLHVTVRDDGKGAPELVEGIGIRGMRERMAGLGGELSVGNAVDGFVVAASLPRRGREEGT
jgi:signal transduction histidine kinase